MDLSIIIVNYKNTEKTLNCLKSINESGLGDLAFEIIVVDNASGDDGAEIIVQKYPEIRLIKSEKNLGMGGGNNLGAKNSRGKYILILNPDTFIKDGAILKLYDYLEKNPRAGIVGPKLLNPDGSLQYSCLRFPKFHTPLLRRTFLGNIFKRHVDYFLMKDFDHEVIKKVDWLMGSALLLRREILEKDGYVFDEKFFMYFEDTELCRRAAAKHGYEVIYYPEAVVIHDHARESAEKPWFVAPFADRLAREHLKSWLKYFFG